MQKAIDKNDLKVVFLNLSAALHRKMANEEEQDFLGSSDEEDDGSDDAVNCLNNLHMQIETMQTVYVGNISYKASEEDLRKFFSVAGKIK